MLLLIQRSKAPGKGLWSFPGGRLELGESLLHAAKRELFEETRLHGTCIGGSEQDIFHVSEAIVSPSGDYLSGDPGASEGVPAFHYVLPHIALHCGGAGEKRPELALPSSTPSDDAATSAWISAATLLGAQEEAGARGPQAFTSLPTTAFCDMKLNPSHSTGVHLQPRQYFVRGLPSVVGRLLQHMAKVDCSL